jgi:hypothetical protein
VVLYKRPPFLCEAVENKGILFEDSNSYIILLIPTVKKFLIYLETKIGLNSLALLLKIRA